MDCEHIRVEYTPRSYSSASIIAAVRGLGGKLSELKMVKTSDTWKCGNVVGLELCIGDDSGLYILRRGNDYVEEESTWEWARLGCRTDEEEELVESRVVSHLLGEGGWLVFGPDREVLASIPAASSARELVMKLELIGGRYGSRQHR